MANVQVKVSGLAELQATLESMPREVARKAIRNGLGAAANLVKSRIVAGAPHRSGFLAEHFNVKFRLRGGELAGSAFIGPAGKTYYPNIGDKNKGVATGKHPSAGGVLPVASVARFIEFGTRKMPARPFIRPAFESAKDQIISIVTSAIQDAIAQWRS